MDLDELRSAQSRERQASQLQHLRDGFYEEAASFIRGLRTERERAAANTDYSFPYDDPEVQRLTNEIQTAEEVVESLYERRVGKVVKMASFDAAGMAVDAEGLTAEESDLFETLVGDIEANRERVLDALAGTAGDGSTEHESADAAADANASAPRSGATPDPSGEPNAEASGDKDRTPPEGADEPVHIGSGPAADGPVSTADEATDRVGESPPERAPAPAADASESAAPESERPAPSRDRPDQADRGSAGQADSAAGDATDASSSDAMDAASAMGGVDDGGTDDTPSRSGERHGDVPDGGPSTADASQSTTDPSSSAETDATAADASATPGTDTAGDTDRPVPPAEEPPGSDPGTGGSARDTSTTDDPDAAGAGAGEGGTAPADPVESPPDSDPSGDAAAPSDQPDGTTGDSGSAGTLVRVTTDVGEIFGVDGRAYDLAAGDVVVLPADNAELLVEDGEAERLEPAGSTPGQSNRS